MKDFRNDLLEELLLHSGEFIEISPLVIKHCGENRGFVDHNDPLVKCRLQINLVLSELKNMDWINLNPSSGISSSHSLNHNTQLREFTFNIPVKVRLTTKGEIEYKRSKQDAGQSKPNIQVGDNFKGILTGGDSQHSTYLEPHLPKETPPAKAGKTKNIIVSILKWTWDNIWKIAVAVIAGYILFRMGWKK